jgi:hypothetical protein
MAKLEDWQQRVVDEQSELFDKLEKLVAFTTAEGFKKLPVDKQEQLVQQAAHMNAYNDILAARIEAF